MTKFRQLLPYDWPTIAAAYTQIRLYRLGLSADLTHVVASCKLLGISLAESNLDSIETALREAVAELEQELS